MSWLPVARYHGTTRGRQHGAGAGSHTTALHWPHRGSTHTSTSTASHSSYSSPSWPSLGTFIQCQEVSPLLSLGSWILSTSLH